MNKSEIKIDIQKYKHNEDYRKIIQNRFKDDLVQPYRSNGEKNPEYIKRYGEDFYKKKVIKSNEEVEYEKTKEREKRRRVVIDPHGGKSQFA